MMQWPLKQSSRSAGVNLQLCVSSRLLNMRSSTSCKASSSLYCRMGTSRILTRVSQATQRVNQRSRPKKQSTSSNDTKICKGQGLWTEVESRKIKGSDTSQQSAVTTVYVDQTIKNRYERSLGFSGMQPNSTLSDASTFAALRNDEFQLQSSITFIKRLGRPDASRVPPLLVVLRQRGQTKQPNGSAKLIRRSTNIAVRSNIYFNPDMTRAEAGAANQMRAQRRHSRQRRAH
jgi:hypothetical protein